MSEETLPVRVGIIMGSDSDLGTMLDAARVLNTLGIGWEINALSAHRTPHHVTRYVEGLEARGVQVVIAGAGGAAHLPGVIAALTPLPVVGVPVKSAALDGHDSLLSIVQMPPGIPVATVGINAARNAGILAAQILGAVDGDVRERVRQFKADLATSVEKRNAKLMDRVKQEL